MTIPLQKIYVAFVSILFMFLSVCSFAATVEASPKNLPIEVSADRLDVDDQSQKLVFSGNAVASQGNATIRADRLTVKYAGQKRDIEQVVAEGAVRIVQGSRVATGGKAVLFNAEQRVYLTGSPKVSEGENSVQGEEITIYLNNQRSVVTGGAGGRVNAVFNPQSEGQP